MTYNVLEKGVHQQYKNFALVLFWDCGLSTEQKVILLRPNFWLLKLFTKRQILYQYGGRIFQANISEQTTESLTMIIVWCYTYPILQLIHLYLVVISLLLYPL